MCVRVVYDGPAGAGKTTNLRQLGQLFAAQRTTEVTSPAELRGRTLYFDWMQIAAGVVCGFPLLCQVISVPGQVAFTERRRHLVASADVIVYVCDSTEEGAARAREALGVVREMGAAPLLLQANKQDQLGALDGRSLLAAVGRDDLLVTEAIATEGIGVVDTFVAAVRTVARQLQDRMERGDLLVPVRSAPGMKRVLAQVAEAPFDPYGAAELLLEEASASMHFAAEEPPTKRTPEKAAPLPRPDVPTGFIWPAHTGRAALEQLGRKSGVADSVAVERFVEYEVDGHVMTTGTDARFADPELARQALVRAARERTQLGPLLVAGTVLVVQPADDGSSWLWTVAPKIHGVKSWLDDARLPALAEAVVSAVQISRRHGIGFEPSLDAFGVQQGSVRYRGPIDPDGRLEISFLDAIAAEVAALGLDVETFGGAVSRALDPAAGRAA